MQAKIWQSHVVLFKNWFFPGKENSVLGPDPMTTDETHKKTPGKFTRIFLHSFLWGVLRIAESQTCAFISCAIHWKESETISQHLQSCFFLHNYYPGMQTEQTLRLLSPVKTDTHSELEWHISLLFKLCSGAGHFS